VLVFALVLRELSPPSLPPTTWDIIEGRGREGGRKTAGAEGGILHRLRTAPSEVDIRRGRAEERSKEGLKKASRIWGPPCRVCHLPLL
jgi:hypothetical protein